MKKHKQRISILTYILAAAMLLPVLFSLLPTQANAASSSEIRKQINSLKEEKEALQRKITEVQNQYTCNENEIADIIAKKNTIDQEIQLLSEQFVNINHQLSAYNTLIADKQEDLEHAQERYRQLQEESRIRIRTMEEDGQLSYWEVLFRANSFSDLLDRLNMVEEITISDNRLLEELGEASAALETAQNVLAFEKAELESTRQEMNHIQAEMEYKRTEADGLIQALLEKAEDLEALEAQFRAQDEEFLNQIARKEMEFNAAKKAEWEAYMETYVPPTTLPPSRPEDSSDASNENRNPNTGGWLVPCSYTSITSPFGHRVSPTTGASTYHQGVDLDTGTGWPVAATRAGIVTVVGYGNAPGNYVKIDHQDGFTSIYMHLNSYSVRSGQIVSAGQNIGTTGSSGIATGDHLHFGITYHGVYVNPCDYVNLR